MKTKYCNKCRTERPVSDFYKINRPQAYQSKCKLCERKYKIKNSARDKINKRNHYEKHREKIKQRSATYKKENRLSRNITNQKYLSIPKNKIVHNFRTRIRQVLKKVNTKSDTTMRLVGCSKEFLIKYLESKFKKGMTWNNYGRCGWHVDHVIPCIKFDFSNPEDQKQCFHYTNLQPLWEKENLVKGGKILNPTQTKLHC